MGFVVAAVVFVFIGLIAVFVGFFVMQSNQKKQKNAPVERVQVKVGSAYTESKVMNQNFTSGSVDSAGGYEQKGYYIQFRTKQNKKLTFRLKKKDWLKYHDGDEGMLTYQGYKIIGFEPITSTIEDGYFMHNKPENTTRFIYGEAQGLGFSVSSTAPVKFELAELKRFIQDLKDDQSDWFFTIKTRSELRQYEKESDTNIKETNLTTNEEKELLMNGFYAYLKSFIE
ncbi:DUF2500 domain-containing protein [Acholeplasma manati]|uniref:DUF2500 domain-containing protein n=1 Tax=Paracholeplasma manati TaxID=591373 RepID=A0ABT2Y3K9_9MOLU|nr:DUF2500 domain-containing protein [Paracholeplasma manati]MCV2231326.1 DUF2500 domain-containing protein [Paracholeplasma manati]